MLTGFLFFLCSLTRCLAPAPLKLRPYGAMQICLLLLLLTKILRCHRIFHRISVVHFLCTYSLWKSFSCKSDEFLFHGEESEQWWTDVVVAMSSGETRLTVDGRDRNGVQRLDKLSDGRWHRIDIFQHRKVAKSVVLNGVGIIINIFLFNSMLAGFTTGLLFKLWDAS